MPNYDDQIPLTTTPIRPFDPNIVGFIPSKAQIELNGTSAKYMRSGRSPTPTHGFTLQNGGTLLLDKSEEIVQLRIIAVSGSGTLQLYATM